MVGFLDLEGMGLCVFLVKFYDLLRFGNKVG